MNSGKISKYFSFGAVIILVVILIAMAIDIELKLSDLSEAEPVVVYNYIDETVSTISSEITVESSVYTFIEEDTSAQNTDDTVTLPQIAMATTGDTTVSTTQMPVFSQSEEASAVITTVFQETYTTSDSTATQAPSTALTTVPETPITTTTQIAATTALSTSQAVNDDPNFYITKTGTKYHRSDCSYLSKSKILVTVDEIIAGGYEPCSRCIEVQ